MWLAAGGQAARGDAEIWGDCVTGTLDDRVRLDCLHILQMQLQIIAYRSKSPCSILQVRWRILPQHFPTSNHLCRLVGDLWGTHAQVVTYGGLVIVCLSRVLKE